VGFRKIADSFRPTQLGFCKPGERCYGGTREYKDAFEPYSDEEVKEVS